MLRFGWPLVLTGFLMFGIMQGDQFLVASFYDMVQLAPYAAAVSLVMAPQFLCGRVFNSVALPLVSRVQDDPPAFRRRYRQILGAMFLYSSVSTAGFMVGADSWMQVVYGAKYAGAGVLLSWLAVVAAFRSLRMAVAVANIAKGDSGSQLIANLWRATSLIPAYLVARHGQPLWMIAACGLVGEVLATLACAWRLKKLDEVPMSLTLRPAVGIVLLSCVAGVLAFGTLGAPVWTKLLIALASAFCAGAAAVALTPELRTEVVVLWHGLRREGPLGAVRQWLGLSGHEAAQVCQSQR
jgi:PST family polysaccharide transporter